ncbi:MAG TPA: hypothetical protein GXX20_11385 [Clostridiaceae bacterium]|nr:hypothetical protein [Clostridiaceae bacterium]
MVERYKFQRNYYIFEVEDAEYGAGKEPIGYIKIEIRKGKGKLSALVQDIKNTIGFIYNLCAFDCSRNDIFKADICNIEVINNKAEVQLEFNPYDFFNSGRSIDNFSVFALLVEPKGSERLKIICPLAAYKDKKEDWRGKLRTKTNKNYIENTKERYEEKHQENQEELIQKSERTEEYKEKEKKEQIEEHKEERIEKNRKECTGKQEEDIKKEYIQEYNNENKKEYIDENKEEGKGEDKREDVEDNKEVAKDIKEKDKEDYKVESKKENNSYEGNFKGDNVPVEENKAPSEEQGKKNLGQEYRERQSPRYWHCPAGISSCTDCAFFKERERAQIEAGTNKTFDFGALAEYFDKYFEKSDPFNSRRKDYRWWEVSTLVYLNNILYQFGIKTTDLFNTNVMRAHLKYRHLIVGIYTDRIRHRGYVVFGIPGVYSVDTRPLGSACRWVQLKGNRPREGAFGYWLAYYEPESGEFLNFS